MAHLWKSNFWTKVMLFCSIILGGCSAATPQPAPGSELFYNPVLSCQRFYRRFDTLVDTYDVTDSQTTPIAGYPHLQINRFLAALVPRLNQRDKLVMWLNLTAQLGLQTNSIELNNLPPAARDQLAAYIPAFLQVRDVGAAVRQCSQTLLHQDILSQPRQKQILQNIKIADNYHNWKRIVGLYPLVALPVALGIHNWHKKTAAILKTPTAQLPVHGKLVTYKTDNQLAYADFKEVRMAMETSRQNPLHIPLPDATTRQRLFATYSPLWEVDTVQDSDRIGAPQWQNMQRQKEHRRSPDEPNVDKHPFVNIHQPTLYTLVSHAILDNQILLQLNYFVWFPARPCTSVLDTLCGNLDGLIWRVTLDSNGKPLIYDTVHDCGCYHLFFPSDNLKQIPDRRCFQESDFVPMQAPEFTPGRRLIIRIATGTHYIDSLYVSDEKPPAPVTLLWQPYHRLRSLPYSASQNKSLFQKNAIVAGTQRKERWFFWPLGVNSPGAMRQWGNHATAFIGKREFDDPYLFEHSFTPVKPEH
jgi:hypothetical protein